MDEHGPRIHNHAGGSGPQEMNFKHLRAFCSVAKNRSFTGACRELNVSQPTISSQVSELERYLNSTLIKRDSRRLELTREGETVFSYAEKIFGLAEELEKEFADLHSLESGALKIGVAYVTMKNLVPSLISELRRRHPNVGLQMFSGLSMQILSKVVEHEYHLGVIARVKYPPNLVCKEIAKEPLHYITRERVPREIDLRDLANKPIVMQAQGAAHRELIIQEFRRRRIPLNICIETDDPNTQKSMVELGIGGSLMPLSAVEEDVRRQRFNVAAVRDGLYFYFDAVFLKERRKSKAIRAILSAIDRFAL